MTTSQHRLVIDAIPKRQHTDRRLFAAAGGGPDRPDQRDDPIRTFRRSQAALVPDLEITALDATNHEGKGMAPVGSASTARPQSHPATTKEKEDGMAETKPVVLETTGVTKSYGAVDALRGVDLRVHAGEIVGILGPNGAGKTTFVELLAGLRVRDQGTIQVLGCDPQQASRAWRARIGAVLQLGTSTDDLKVGEVLRSHAAYYPTARDIDNLAADLELTDLMDRKVSKLSGGQRRRLDIAIGVIGEPEILFLDEPTTGLDPEVRRRIWDFVQQLADNGTTILLTTHYLDEVEWLADRVLVIVDGEVVARGTAAEVMGTSATTTVTFRIEGDIPESIPELPGKQVSHGRGVLSFETEDSTLFITELLAWAGSKRSIHDLAVSKPNLEATYLSLLETLSSTREEV